MPRYDDTFVDRFLEPCEAWELVEGGLITEDNFSRFHLRQCSAAMGHAEPTFL